MKILITGGVGFIGSHLVDYWVSRNCEVVVIDNESAKCNEKYYNDKAIYYKKDVADLESTRECYKNVDYVFHLAAEARIQLAIQNPEKTLRTNVLGTAIVLQNSFEAGVKRVIYSSSSSVYGNNKCPFKEDMELDCLNTYALSKRFGELYCKTFLKKGLDIVILRYFNVYGKREPFLGELAPIVGKFLLLKKEGKPLTIIGDGLQTRDFTHIEDVVRANILAATERKAIGEVLNIGTGLAYSILELAKMISSDLIYTQMRCGEAKSTLADIAKANLYLGWFPRKRLQDYIKEELA